MNGATANMRLKKAQENRFTKRERVKMNTKMKWPSFPGSKSFTPLVLVGLVFWSFVIPPRLQAASSIREQLLAEARREGTIDAFLPSTVSPQGARELGDAFNRNYSLNVRFTYHPSANALVQIGKVVSWGAAGIPPEWDVMAGITDAQHGTLYLKKLHKTFDYRTLGVDAKAIRYDGGTVVFANQIVLPGYNKQFVSPHDAPKRWEDLLDPKWKGGKLGVHTATHHFARLAVGLWGEKKTTEYVKALAKQEPIRGGPGEMYMRLQMGEVLVVSTVTDSTITQAKRTGAPVVFAEELEPVISPEFQAGVLKNARHPNVGHLFVAFLATSQEAQRIWMKYGGQTSAYIPGTPTYEYLKGKKVLFMTADQVTDIDKLSIEYAKILGF